LLDTGCFTNVVVEEQTPTPDRQKLTVRMSAQWNAAAGRDALAPALAALEAEKNKPAAKEVPPAKEGPVARPAPPAAPAGTPKPGPQTAPSNP
jgi:hypothetical protein